MAQHPARRRGDDELGHLELVQRTVEAHPGARGLAALGVAGRPFVLLVGRLRRKKNFGAVLEAVAERREGVVLVGPEGGASAALRSRATRPDLAGRVVFSGYLPDDDLMALYRAAACLVVPARIEGFGLPALEAMAFGVPVVVSREAAVEELVAGDAVEVFDSGEPQALAAALARVLDDAGRRAALAARGRRRARQLDAAGCAGRVLAVWRELVGPGAAGARAAPAEAPAVLNRSTATALAGLTEAGALSREEGRNLREALDLYDATAHRIALCVDGDFDPETAPAGLRSRLSEAAALPDFARLEAHIKESQVIVRAIFERCLGAVSGMETDRPGAGNP